MTSVSACVCKLDASNVRTIDPAGTLSGWSTVCGAIEGGTAVSIRVPDGWEEPDYFHKKLIARMAPAEAEDVRTSVTVTIHPLGDADGLCEYVRDKKRAIDQSSVTELTGESAVRLNNRDAYEIAFEMTTPVPHESVDMVEVVGEEVVIVSCAFAKGELETTRKLCDDLFGTVTILDQCP